MGATRFSFRISSFKQPNSVITSASWTLFYREIRDFTVLAMCSSTTVPYSMLPGSITGVAWTAVNGWDPNMLVFRPRYFYV